MNNEFKSLREFGRCRLDVEKKYLWCEEKPVQLPLKAIELLCVLVESSGTVVTKDEIWQRVWQDSYVEETNLTHNIYLLRKTFKDLGEPDLIQTVPRRGYRFAGDVHGLESENDEIIIERRAFSQTLIEELTDDSEIEPQRYRGDIGEKFQPEKQLAPSIAASRHPRAIAIVIAAILLIPLVLGFVSWRYYQFQSDRQVSLGKIKSIAVMPFSNVHMQSEDELLAEALTDSVTAKLGRFSGLIVRPSSAAREAQRDKLQSVGEIGNRLGVDAVLQGAIFHNKFEKTMTVRLQLLRCADGELLWEETITQEGDNLLAVQTAVGMATADSLLDKLTNEQRILLTRQPTKNELAYRAYLKGNFYLAKRDIEANPLAVKYYQEAIARDPRFALAYVGLADVWAMTKSPAPEAEAYLEKALELDTELAEAHASLGFIRMFQKWDWSGAEYSLRRAIELNPNSAKAHQWLATFLMIHRRFDEAETAIRRALEIDPNSAPINTDLCEVFYYKRDFEAARRQCEAVLDTAPQFSFAKQRLTKIYFFQNDLEKSFQMELSFTGDDKTRESLEKAFRQNGFRGFIEANLGAGHNLNYETARQLALLGDTERAVQILESEVERRAFLVVFANADPIFDKLRGDARFQKILRKMNLSN